MPEDAMTNTKTAKTYLLISPQRWGKMLVSQHHYALELAAQGHSVFFLNPLSYSWRSGVSLSKSQAPGQPRIHIVDCILNQALFHLRFQLRPLYDLLIQRFLLPRLNKIARFDEIWCFEPILYSTLDPIDAAKKLFMPFDRHTGPHLGPLSRSCDGIVSVSRVILDNLPSHDKPTLLLNHGLSAAFAARARSKLTGLISTQSGSPVQIGYSGNLFQGNILDRKTIESIIRLNPDTVFHFWGPNRLEDSNLGGAVSERTMHFLDFLSNTANVRLHGILPTEELAEAMSRMDAFIVAYHAHLDPNQGSNSHKIMEYLSTGKTVISSRISSFATLPGLLEMPEGLGNENLPCLFKKTIEDLPNCNSESRQRARIEFALSNSYTANIEKIERFLGPEGTLRTMRGTLPFSPSRP